MMFMGLYFQSKGGFLYDDRPTFKKYKFKGRNRQSVFIFSLDFDGIGPKLKVIGFFSHS